MTTATRPMGTRGPSRRQVLTAAGAFLALPAVGLVAGCSDDGQGGFGSTPRPRRTEPTKKRFSGRLVIGIIQDPPEAAKRALTEGYRRHQPDVEIVWETKDFGGVDNYVNWLGTQLAAGNIRPDIVSGNYVPTFSGYVNFDEYRDAVNPYTGNPWSEDMDFRSGRELNVWAQRYLMATQSFHVNWFYNKELFDQAGVEPPATWDEFVDVCERLRSKGITPISANYQWQVPQWLTEIYFDQYHVDWVETVRAREGDWNYDPEIDGSFEFDPNEPDIHSLYTYSPQRFYGGIAKGDLRFDTPSVTELVANLARVFPRSATKDFYVLTDAYTPFLQQQTAIMLGGTGDLGTLSRDLAELTPERLKELGIKPGSVRPFEWGVFENPAMEGDLVKCKPRSVESSSGEYLSVIDKNAEQRALAVDFCMFWLSSAGYSPYLDAQIESGEFVASGPCRVRGVEYPQDVQERFEMVQLMGNAEVLYNQFWTAGPDQETRTDLRNLLKQALDGRVTPREYANQLQAYVQDNLDRMLESSSLTRGDIDNPARRPESA